MKLYIGRKGRPPHHYFKNFIEIHFRGNRYIFAKNNLDLTTGCKKILMISSLDKFNFKKGINTYQYNSNFKLLIVVYFNILN